MLYVTRIGAKPGLCAVSETLLVCVHHTHAAPPLPLLSCRPPARRCNFPSVPLLSCSRLARRVHWHTLCALYSALGPLQVWHIHDICTEKEPYKF